MRVTHQLLRKGVFGRSLDHIKWQTGVVLNQETIKGAKRPKPLYEWTDDESVHDTVIMSDTIIGGQSTSHMDFITASDSTPSTTAPWSPSTTTPPSSYARFHGSISTALPSDRPEVKRTGYAGFRTPSQGMTLFGRSYWDIDPYAWLAMRVKSDGRAYFVNVQTESVEPTDLHQHRLYAKRPGEWETVLLKWNDFVRTNHGFVIEPQTGMLRQKVRTIGVGLTDRVEGPFELCIERIWATNTPEDADVVVEETKPAVEEDARASGLKTRKGTKIHW
ncbi:complex I intermediate-associated protein 30 (CIA30) domain-containing protein [Sarocladium implicatum]|nr:complex I intermediate-associated protein 30 (CIA30) domain-containing protein [Sarocladium implicatum]